MKSQKAQTAQKLERLLAILPNLDTEHLRCLLWLLHLLDPKSDRQFLLDSIKAKVASCGNVSQFVEMAELLIYGISLCKQGIAHE
jgi:hypothetical protein